LNVYELPLRARLRPRLRLRPRPGPSPRRSRAHTQNITPPQSLTVERRRGRTAGSIRIDTSTRCEPSVFEQNNLTGIYAWAQAQARARLRSRSRSNADANNLNSRYSNL